MKLTFLGTCSGTEPVANYRHVAFTAERDGAVYWFDAGEGCSYTAHLAGIDLLAVKAVFISHTHMDHVGGLANLLWTMRKLNDLLKDKSRSLSGKMIRVFIPDLEVWAGVQAVLRGSEGGFRIDYRLDGVAYADGIIFDENGFKVTALHNLHLGAPADGRTWRSFSFRMEWETGSVVYSGDVGDVSDLAPLLDRCDLLLMETGHHKVERVCEYLKAEKPEVGRLGFIHHGRAILDDPDGELRKAQGILGERRVFIATDGMTMTVP